MTGLELYYPPEGNIVLQTPEKTTQNLRNMHATTTDGALVCQGKYPSKLLIRPMIAGIN